MKKILTYILEAQTEKAIEQFANMFKETVLKDQKLTKNDFKNLGNGSFELKNFDKSGIYAKDFYNKRSSLSCGMTSSTSKDYIKLGIPQSGKDEIFIKLNLDGKGDSMAEKLGKGTPGNIISVEMSKEIKDKLI